MDPNQPPPAIQATSTEAFARRYVHDSRNTLNGLVMEISLLEQQVPDQEALQSIARISDGVAQLEQNLCAVTLRLTPVSRATVPALDLYTSWNSRAARLRPSPGIDRWDCALDTGLLDVDMRKVADGLAELLLSGDDQPLTATATPHDQGVSFSVRHRSPEAHADAPRHPLPGLAEVFAANGGSYSEHTDPDSGEFVTACWFPLTTTS